jgi:tetratricopeptide (TPR) repeat protein
VAKERSGDVEGSVMALHNEAEILSDQGHFHGSEALFQEALRIARAAGHRLIEAFVTANLGRLAARTGRFDEARALLEEAAATLTAIGSQSLGVETELRLAECLVFEGRHREAFELAERTLRRAGELSRLGTLGPSLERTIGFALWQGNRCDESLAHFERSLQLARESNARYEIALTLQAVAETTGVPSPEAAALFELLGVVESPKVPLLEQGLRVSGRS